jgi:hypothetical protein
MKSFKTFMSKIKSKDSWKDQALSWDGMSHGELRDKKSSWEDNPISWDNSTHGELRKKDDLKEALAFDKPKRTVNKWFDESPEVTGKLYDNKHGKLTDGFFKEIRPKEITPEQEKVIHQYTTGSSKDPEHGPGVSGVGNSLLDEIHKNNGKVDLEGSIGLHKRKEIWNRIKTFTSAWSNPNNTNHRKIITYSGIPHHIGEHFGSLEEGDEGHLARNVSSSIHRRVAYGFAKSYWKGLSDKQRKHVHLAEWHVHPGAGLPMAEMSGYGENEVGFRYGTKISKIGSYKKSITDPVTGKSITAFVHKMAVHPEFKDHQE